LQHDPTVILIEMLVFIVQTGGSGRYVSDAEETRHSDPECSDEALEQILFDIIQRDDEVEYLRVTAIYHLCCLYNEVSDPKVIRPLNTRQQRLVKTCTQIVSSKTSADGSNILHFMASYAIIVLCRDAVSDEIVQVLIDCARNKPNGPIIFCSPLFDSDSDDYMMSMLAAFASDHLISPRSEQIDVAFELKRQL